MATKSNFTAKLIHLDYLRELVAGMGYVLTRGRGAGKVGSIQQFLDRLSDGEVVAFPLVADAGEMLAAAERLEELAAAETVAPAVDVLRDCAEALRRAAERVVDLDEAELADEGEAYIREASGKLGRYADAESARRSAALALFPVVIRFDDGSFDWQHADRPVEHPVGRYEIVARREGVGPWR